MLFGEIWKEGMGMGMGWVWRKGEMHTYAQWLALEAVESPYFPLDGDEGDEVVGQVFVIRDFSLSAT